MTGFLPSQAAEFYIPQLGIIYFTSRLPHRFCLSPKVVQEAIMTDINSLVQEFWRTSTDGAVGVSFFAMHRLFEILQVCYDVLFQFLRLPLT